VENRGSRYKLIVSYDGTGFSGSQRQRNGRSVQQELETALERLAGKPVAATFSGRTDRGVHAIGQVVGIERIRDDLTPERLQAALNGLLPRDVSVNDVTTVDLAFHPRFDARWREYRYRVWVGSRQPLLERYAWQCRGPFDLAAANTAATLFRGEHDLASFAGMGHGVPWSERQQRRRGTIRNVMRCSVSAVPEWWGAAPDTGSGYEIRVVADGFLPNMVRTMTAGLAEVASGARSPDWVSEVLQARDRRQGPKTAPPHGLIFWRVGYGDDVPDADPVLIDTIG
jgi:tRNA pseudouridine38-40 synthase